MKTAGYHWLLESVVCICQKMRDVVRHRIAAPAVVSSTPVPGLTKALPAADQTVLENRDANRRSTALVGGSPMYGGVH